MLNAMVDIKLLVLVLQKGGGRDMFLCQILKSKMPLLRARDNANRKATMNFEWMYKIIMLCCTGWVAAYI